LNNPAKKFLLKRRNRRKGQIFVGFEKEEMLDDLLEEREEAGCPDIYPRITYFTKIFKNQLHEMFKKIDIEEVGIRRPKVVEFFNRLSREVEDPK